MSNTSLSKRQQLSEDLANARQMIQLLKSQLKSGKVDTKYWLDRVDYLGSLLQQLAEEQDTARPQGRFAALYEVSKVLGSSLNLEEVLNQVMDAIIKLSEAERGYLMLFDEAGELEIMAARNLDRQSLDEDEFAISRSVIRTVAETGEQVVTTNATEDPRFASQASVVTHNLRAIQCIPLRVRGEIIGVIYVDNRVRSGVFNEADLETLATFAAQAAIAIDNARLFTQTDEALAARVEELSVMQEIDRQLAQSLDFVNVMDMTLEWAIRITEADDGMIGMVNSETGNIDIVAQHGETDVDIGTLLNYSSGDNDLGRISAPIQREGKVIGLITLGKNVQPGFSSETQDFVYRLADRAAIAIQNAQLYEAVKQANQAKSEFVSVVTHELRVPMTSIKGYTDMILITGDLGEKQKSYLDIVRNNVERMSLMVSDLSDISRIESGRMQLEIDNDVDSKTVLDEILPALQNEIQKRGHEFELDFPRKVPHIQVDPRRLGQVFTNLISNAYKYTPSGGKITVRAQADGAFVRFSVSDTGIGMTSEEVSNLFTKFWRAESVQVREQTGTGLGLTIAKNLVELHRGQMTVQSEKDVGTTFSFTIPVSQG